VADSAGNPHSFGDEAYGGIPTSQAAVGATNVVRLAYLAAFQLDDGESLLSAVGADLPADVESIPL
jgi:hypothetical protein